MFQDSIVLQLPEETWAQGNPNQIKKWPESLGVMLKFFSNVGYCNTVVAEKWKKENPNRN